MTGPEFDDPVLVTFVSLALEAIDRGEDPDLEEICSGRPDLVDAVRQTLETSHDLPALTRASTVTDRSAGKTLGGRYRLDHRMGSGAMGVVYAAYDLELRRTVAVKVLRSALVDGAEAEARFDREAEALAAIDHAVVVTIYDRGKTEEGDPFLIMELLEGIAADDLLGELAERESRGYPDTAWLERYFRADALREPSYLRTAVTWAADLASGLAASHAAGVLHRDIKPSNIFLRRNGRPVLLDFGIAARDSHATLTRTGMPLGTPSYMAPESLSEKHDAPGRAHQAARDVYGLTATLYHFITGRAPYSGTPSQVLAQLATKDPPRADRLRPGLPRDLMAILDRGMARDPRDRYPSAETLEADLRAFLEYRPVSARPLTATTRLIRRARRSVAFRTVTVTALVLVAVYSVSWARESRALARSAEYERLLVHLPPNAALSIPENRVMSLEEGREGFEERLRRMVELSAEPLPSRLLWAMFLFDHGRASEAADEMERLARALDTDYARAPAERYRRYVESGSTAPDVDLSGLPDPGESMDVFLDGYHGIRIGDQARMRSVLEDERLDEFLPALELRPLLLSAFKQDPHEIYEQTVEATQRRGIETATTNYLLGSALFQLDRYAQALEVFERGLELAPHSHQLMLNAGWSAFHDNQLGLARECLEQVIEWKPLHLRARKNLVMTFIELQDLDAAAEVLDPEVFSSTGNAEYLGIVLEGNIEASRALALLRAGMEEEGLETAAHASGLFELAAELGREVDSPYSRMVDAVLEDRDAAVFDQLLDLLKEAPLLSRRVANLREWWPDSIDDVRSEKLAEYMELLEQQLRHRPQRPGDLPRADTNNGK